MPPRLHGRRDLAGGVSYSAAMARNCSSLGLRNRGDPSRYGSMRCSRVPIDWATCGFTCCGVSFDVSVRRLFSSDVCNGFVGESFADRVDVEYIKRLILCASPKWVGTLPGAFGLTGGRVVSKCDVRDFSGHLTRPCAGNGLLQDTHTLTVAGFATPQYRHRISLRPCH